MRSISNTSRPDSNGEASIQDRNFTSAFTGQDAYQETVKKAESLSLVKIFKHYNLSVDNYNRKIVCPFKKHKGGRESTPSLYFYPETNTFWCFGCKTGVTSVDFVANIENINKLQAAIKIINLYKSNLDVEPDFQIYKESFEEKNILLFDFSKRMRDIIKNNPSDLNKVEEIYSIFDKMNDKYDLDIKAIRSLIEKLNERLDNIK